MQVDLHRETINLVLLRIEGSSFNSQSYSRLDKSLQVYFITLNVLIVETELNIGYLQ